MVAWFDSISLTVNMAFGDTPQEATPTWTDVSAYVRALEVERGTGSEYVSIAPGTCRVRLDNTDRRFDPDHATGPYFGDLVPMVKMRVQAVLGATTVTLFIGFVQGWPQTWLPFGDGTVDVTAVDTSRFLGNTPLAGSAYAAEIAADNPIAYVPFQTFERDGQVTPEVVTAGSLKLYLLQGEEQPAPVDIGFPVGASSGVGLASANLGTGSIIFRDPSLSWTATAPKTVEFWFRPGDIGDGSGSSSGKAVTTPNSTNGFQLGWNESSGNWSAVYSNSTDNKYTNTLAVWHLPAGNFDGVWHAVATADTTNLYLYINGVLRSTVALTTGTYLVGNLGEMRAEVRWSSGDTQPAISHVAFYSGTLTAARITAHYEAGVSAWGHPHAERTGTRIGRVLDEVGWPAGARVIDPGQTIHGPYLPAGMTVLDHLEYLVRAEQGLLFTDVDGNVHFVDRQSLWKAASVATFSDDGAAGAIKFHDLRPYGNHVDTIRNIVTTSYSTVGAITRRDTTSITNYGESREFLDCPTLPDGSSASNLSAYVLRERKDPRSYIESVSAHMRIDGGDNEFEKLAALELGDKVTVEHTPRGVGSQAVRTGIVRRVRHDISLAQWDVTVDLSPAPTSYTAAPYLTLGDATYGKIGAVAGNKIPY